MKRFAHSLAPVDSLSTIDEMLIHSDGQVVDGERVWVRSVGASFRYSNPYTGAAADGISVVQSSFGAGAWVRIPDSTNPTWLLQNSWYIDPTNGNDENVGSTLGTALKTWAELRRRTNGRSFKQSTSIALVTADLPGTDPMIVDMGSEGSLSILGSGNIVKISTLTAVTPAVPATNTPLKVKDGAFNWTAAGYLGANYLLSMTAGAANGAFAFIALDETAGVARLLPMVNIAGTIQTPGNDAYIVSLMRGVAKAYISPTLLVAGGLNIEFVAFPSGPPMALGGRPQSDSVTFTGCSFGTTPATWEEVYGTFIGCRFVGGTFNMCRMVLIGGGTIGATPMQFAMGSACELRTVMAQGTGWVSADSSYISIANAGAMDFDTAQFGLNIIRGSQVWANLLWGKANSTGVGCVIDVSSTLIGSTSDFRYIIGPTNALKVGTAAAVVPWPAGAGKTADASSLAVYMHE
jgi:hypothetical protein